MLRAAPTSSAFLGGAPGASSGSLLVGAAFPCVCRIMCISPSLFSGVQMALALPCHARQLLNWGPQWAWQEGFYAALGIISRALQGSCEAPASSIYRWLVCAGLALFAAGFGCGLLVRRRAVVLPLNVARESSIAVQVGEHPAKVGSAGELPRQLAAYLAFHAVAGSLPRSRTTPLGALAADDDGIPSSPGRCCCLRRLQRGRGAWA